MRPHPRHWLCLFLLSALCVAAAGCRVSQGSLTPRPALGTRLAETNAARMVDEETAGRLARGEADVGEQETLQAADVAQNAEVGDVPPAASSQAAPRRVERVTPRAEAEPGPEQPSTPVPAEAVAADSPWGEIRLPALSEPGVADKLVSVNFNDVDIRVFLKTVSDITGVNFVVDDNVRGTVTLISPTEVRLGEVFKVLESVLEVKGYAAVPAGSLVKIVPKAQATQRNLATRIGADPQAIPPGDTLVTQLIPLRYADAAEVNSLISPLASTGSYVTTYPRTNTILITDTSSNIRRIAEIISVFDVPGTQEEVSVVRLQYASAQVLGQQLTQMLEQSQAPARARTARAEVGQPGGELKILPDTRTNSLIVLGSPKDTEMIESLVALLDVERPLEASNIHVVYLKNATALELGESLSAAMERLAKAEALQKLEPVQITADESTNALIITASPQDFIVVADMIEKLDIVRDQVLVEMRIVEASEDALREIGIDWATLDDAVTDSVRGFGYTNFGLRVESVTGDLEGLALGLWKRTGPDDSIAIGAILKALQSDSRVNILSTPHILTSNHQQATIRVGENIPYVKESRVTETDVQTPTVIKTYDYKDVGITLNITPHISQGGLVRLEVQSEFSKLIEGTTGTGADTPTTATREAQTVVSIMSGATVVIGGLMRDDTITVTSKVPLFGDIPLLGALFRWQRDRSQKTNLLMFITPYVLAEPEDLTAMTEQKETEAESRSTFQR